MAREQTAPAEPARLDGVEMSEDELAAELAWRLDVLRRDRKPASRPAAVPQQPPPPIAEPPRLADQPRLAEPSIDHAGDMSNDALADEISRRLESWKETRGQAKPAPLLHPTEQAFSRPQPRSEEILRSAHMRIEQTPEQTPPAVPKSAPPRPTGPIEMPAAKRRDWTVTVPPDHYARDYYGQKAHDSPTSPRRHRMPLLTIALLATVGVLMPGSWNPVALYRGISAPAEKERPAAEAEIGPAPGLPQAVPAHAPENRGLTVAVPPSPQMIAPAVSPPLAHEDVPAAIPAAPPPIEAVVVPEKAPQVVPQDKKAPPSEKTAAPETPSASAMKAKPFEPSGNVPTPTVMPGPLTPAPGNAWLKVKPFEPSSQ